MMISDYHKLNDAGSIALADLKLSNLPDSISVEGVELMKKTEFHITLVSAKSVLDAIGREVDKQQLQAEIVEEFKKFIATKPIKDYELLREFRYVQRGSQKTVVVMVKVENIKQFFDLLRAKYQADIPDQPTHITLYSLDPLGIYLNSKEDLKRDTRIIEAPELRKITKVEP